MKDTIKMPVSLTKREYFAGLAMQGISCSAQIKTMNQAREVVRKSIQMADDMMFSLGVVEK